MAGRYTELFRQDFTTTNLIEIAHGLNLQFPDVRVLIGENPRPDLIKQILVNQNDPTNTLRVELVSPQSGTVQIVELDAIDSGTVSASNLVRQNVDYVLGENYNYAENVPTQTTSSTAFVNALTLNTPSIDFGAYLVLFSFIWNYDTLAADFQARIQIDGVTVWSMNREPNAVGAMGYNVDNFVEASFNLAGAHTITLDYAASNAAHVASIAFARLAIWQVS